MTGRTIRAAGEATGREVEEKTTVVVQSSTVVVAWASESEYGLGWSGGRRVAAGKRWEHAGWGGQSERGREVRGSRADRAVVSERE